MRGLWSALCFCVCPSLLLRTATKVSTALAAAPVAFLAAACMASRNESVITILACDTRAGQHPPGSPEAVPGIWLCLLPSCATTAAPAALSGAGSANRPRRRQQLRAHRRCPPCRLPRCHRRHQPPPLAPGAAGTGVDGQTGRWARGRASRPLPCPSVPRAAGPSSHQPLVCPLCSALSHLRPPVPVPRGHGSFRAAMLRSFTANPMPPPASHTALAP